jgi:organic hydroperoxide reductase OsmC/OhrA
MTQTTHETPPGTARAAGAFQLELEQVDGFAFRVRFDHETMPDLRTDEPPPLGADRGPNPARLLAAAIGNCLAASLLFCMQKRKVRPISLQAVVDVQLVRNERKRLRIGQVHVVLRPQIPGDDDAVGEIMSECMEQFRDFCVVTESVREGLDVKVDVDVVTEGPEGPTS